MRCRNKFATIPLFLFLSFSLYLSGCAVNSHTVLYHVDGFGRVNRKTMERLLWENTMASDQDILSTTILRGDLASYHLIQISGSEKPHRHDFHDLVIFVQSGYGTMFFEKESIKIKGGTVIFIPHGTPHYFVNTSPSPTTAIAVFSPSYDGKDDVPVELRPAKNKQENYQK